MCQVETGSPHRPQRILHSKAFTKGHGIRLSNQGRRWGRWVVLHSFPTWWYPLALAHPRVDSSVPFTVASSFATVSVAL